MMRDDASCDVVKGDWPDGFLQMTLSHGDLSGRCLEMTPGMPPSQSDAGVSEGDAVVRRCI